jgi:hypothetical protein
MLPTCDVLILVADDMVCRCVQRRSNQPKRATIRKRKNTGTEGNKTEKKRKEKKIGDFWDKILG